MDHKLERDAALRILRHLFWTVNCSHHTGLTWTTKGRLSARGPCIVFGTFLFITFQCNILKLYVSVIWGFYHRHSRGAFRSKPIWSQCRLYFYWTFTLSVLFFFSFSFVYCSPWFFFSFSSVITGKECWFSLLSWHFVVVKLRFLRHNIQFWDYFQTSAFDQH